MARRRKKSKNLAEQMQERRDKQQTLGQIIAASFERARDPGSVVRASEGRRPRRKRRRRR